MGLKCNPGGVPQQPIDLGSLLPLWKDAVPEGKTHASWTPVSRTLSGIQDFASCPSSQVWAKGLLTVCVRSRSPMEASPSPSVSRTHGSGMEGGREVDYHFSSGTGCPVSPGRSADLHQAPSLPYHSPAWSPAGVRASSPAPGVLQSPSTALPSPWGGTWTRSLVCRGFPVHLVTEALLQEAQGEPQNASTLAGVPFPLPWHPSSSLKLPSCVSGELLHSRGIPSGPAESPLFQAVRRQTLALSPRPRRPGLQAARQAGRTRPLRAVWRPLSGRPSFLLLLVPVGPQDTRLFR